MMCIRDETSALALASLFKGLDMAQLRKLAFTSDRVSFKPGEAIISQGVEAKVGYVVMCGEADVEVDTSTGSGLLERVGAGYLAGEAALLSDVPYLVTVRAVTPVETLAISKDAILKMIQACPDATGRALKSLSDRIAQLESEKLPTL